MGFPATPVEDRLWRKIAVHPLGCWEYQGAISRGGYGVIGSRPGPTAQQAHRVAWEVTWGPIPAGLLVCHRCDNRRCVRPDHLFLGDAKANLRDASRKGRIGRASPSLKHRIRREYAAGGVSQQQLADRYGFVSGGSISKIVHQDW